MPRTVPSGIAALVGQVNIRVLWLVKWELNTGTKYYSSGPSVSFGGNTYEANRIRTVSSVVAQYVDRKRRDFSRLSITFDNLADNGSASFPFTVLDAAEIFEDKKLTVYAYFPDQGEGLEVWWGYSGRPKFNPSEKTVEITGSFLWDSRELVVPTRSLPQAGFETLDTGRNKEPLSLESVLPLTFGVSSYKIRPVVYSFRVDGAHLYVNFIVSGTAAGLPMQANDVSAAQCRLFGTAPALSLEFHPGGTDVASTNLTRFPDGLAHNDVAYGVAVFAITEQVKDKLDDITSDDVKMTLVNGPPLIDTGLPSENPVLIFKNVLRSPLDGLGIANAAFDSAVVSASAAHVGPKWQSRLELRERMSVGDFVQAMCADFNGFVTFNNSLIQIGVKTNAESSVATFATVDSGFSGRKIHKDDVWAWEDDSTDIDNQLRISYRKKNRQKRDPGIIMYDPTAQTRAGANIKKVTENDIDSLTLFDETQLRIHGAIILREEQNGNLPIEFEVPFVEGLLPAPGDVITVRSPDIFNNSSNHEFRIIAQTFELGDEPLCKLTCRVYKPAIYDYTSTGIGVDLLRGGEDTSLQGRPPDVVPVSLQIKDVVANDTEGKLATVLAMWTYPTVDLATEQADGIFREHPIGSVQLWWHYTDESENEARMGKEIKYPTAQGEFQIDYHKNRSIKVWFVALGHNRSRAKLGLIPDATKVSSLTFSLAAGGGTASVSPTTPFTVGNYVFIENEINRVFSKSAFTLEMYPGGGLARTAFFNTTAIAHPAGTEVAVAKESYPSLTLPLTAPRFTYKTVTGLFAHQRPDGVRAKWLDVDAANRETYYVIWTMLADGGTNPALLGSATPAWYLANPDAPPAGVNISRNDDLSHLILQEDIGPAGTPVFVRVAARNGKHNFSAQLSVLKTNSAGGSTLPPPTDAPSTPSLALFQSQGPYLATSLADSLDVIRVFASEANNSLTFAQTGTPELILIFRDAGSTKDDPWPYVVDDQNVTFVDVPVIGTLGKSRIHRRNVASNGAGGKTKSPVVAIPFFAGGKVTSLTGITSFAITSVVPIANTKGRKSDVNYTWTSPNPAPLIAKAFVMQKNSAESVFSKEAKNPLLDEETMQTPGVKVDTIRVGHPKNDAGQYKIRLVSVDGTILESAIFNSTSQDEDTAAPNNGVPIAMGTPKLKNGSFLMVPYTVPTVQMNTYEKTVVQIHDNNETGTGRKFFNYLTSAWVTVDPELLFANHTRVAHGELFVSNRTRVYVRIGIKNRFNGGATTYSSDLVAFIDSSFIAGNPSEPDDVRKDTTAPATLNTPILDFSRGLFAKMSMSGVAQINTLKLVEATISNGASSLNLNTPSLETIVAGADVFYSMAKQTPKLSLPISKRKLRKLFGQTSSIYVKFRLTNDIGSTTSAASISLPLDAIIDVTPPTDDNQLWNGHFVHLESAGTLANWQAYQPAGSNAFNILDIGTGRLRYQDSEHRAKFQVNPVSDLDTNKRWLVQFLGDLLKGSFYAGYFLILADGNRSVDFDIFIVTINGGTRQIESLDFNNNKNPINVATSLIANVPKRVEYEFRYATDANTTLNTYFCLRLNSRVDAGLGDAFVYVDEFQMNPGRVPGPFTNRRLKEGNTRSRGPVASQGTAQLTTGEEFGTAATNVNLSALVEAGEGGSGLGRGVVY